MKLARPAALPAAGTSQWPGWRHWWLAALVCALLTAWSAPLVTGDSIKGDATQNLRIAYNLFHHGAFALNAPGTPGATDAPTSFREPVPPVFVAAYVRLRFPSASTDFEAWHYGDFARQIKRGNLVWVFAGLLGFWALCTRLLRRPAWVALAMLLAYTYFFHNPNLVDSLYTELHAGVLLVWTSALLLLTLDSRRWTHALLAGTVMGLLCLTKSVFQGAGPLVVAALFVLCLRVPGQPFARTQGLRLAGTILLAFALVVAPWIARNKVQMDSTEVSAGRSGYVMFKRALMDQMNPDEFRLGFDLYGPDAYRQWVTGSAWGMVLPDDVLKGGRLQRMNPYRSDFQDEDNRSIAQGRPDLSLTFYRKPAALYQQMRQLLADSQVPHAELVADKLMQRQALHTMLTQPVAHARVGLLLFWRGFWWAPRHIPGPFSGTPDLFMGFNQWVNLFAGLALVVALGIALFKRNLDWLAVSALPLTMLLMHAALTHGLPRFSVPAIPLMLLCLVGALRCCGVAAASRLRNRHPLRPQ